MVWTGSLLKMRAVGRAPKKWDFLNTCYGHMGWYPFNGLYTVSLGKLVYTTFQGWRPWLLMVSPLHIQVHSVQQMVSTHLCTIDLNAETDRILLQVVFQSCCGASVKFHLELRSVNSTCCQNSNTIYNTYSVSADPRIAFSIAIPQTLIDSRSVSSLESECAAKQTSKHRTTTITLQKITTFSITYNKFST